MDYSNKLTNIEERLCNIEITLNEIKELLKPVKTSCAKMQSHISFVEQTYDSVKSQLGYFINLEPIIPEIKNI